MRAVTVILIFVALAVASAMVYSTAPRSDNTVWALLGEAFGWSDTVVQARSWSDWIYYFQSLVGGTFALLAATVTVAQMYMTDFEAERRHREIMERQTKAENMRVERFLTPAYSELCSLEDLADTAVPRMSNDFSSDFETTRHIIVATQRCLARRQFASAEDLLDGAGAAAHEAVRSAAHQASENVERLHSAVQRRATDEDRINAALGINIREMRVGIKDLIAAMERVAERFVVQVTRPARSLSNVNDDTAGI